MKEEKKAAKPKLMVHPANQLTSVTPPATAITEPLTTVSLGLRFLRKKNGSTILQEGVNDVWTDVPMVVEK